jgi:uncharacterized protein YjbJ (UPF0337 family)
VNGTGGRVPTLLSAAGSIAATQAHCGPDRYPPAGKEVMKPSTKDQARGKLENLKGKIKEVAGIVTGQRKLEAEGKDQTLAGKVREKLGQVEKVFGK